jgi:hypothetical protein
LHSSYDWKLLLFAGPCKAIKERWYYNPSRGCCEKFLYGGCQGNSNNFQSYEECNKMCSGSFTIGLKPAGLNWNLVYLLNMVLFSFPMYTL